MNPESEVKFISDRRQFTFDRLLILSLVPVIVLFLGAVAYYVYTTNILNNPPITNEEKTPIGLTDEEITRIKNEVNSQPYEYLFVPNALDIIGIPPPAESTEMDKLSYDMQKPSVNPTPEEVIKDHVYFLDFKGQAFGDYINSDANGNEITQINDELAHLTQQLNNLYQQIPLKDRISGVTQLVEIQPVLEKEGNNISVYPSIRAVVAYSAKEIMTKLDPSNAQKYQKDADALVSRGIGYGLYGQSDAEAARSLVSQYFVQYFKNKPDTLSALTIINQTESN